MTVSGSKGFTLLEVMIALAIIAGVMVTVLTSFGYHLDIANRDREETVAMLLARNKLDECRLRGEKTGKGTFEPSWPGISWDLALEPSQWPGIEKLNLNVAWDAGRKRMQLTQYREKQL
jgi:general secretion pathway protein I